MSTGGLSSPFFTTVLGSGVASLLRHIKSFCLFPAELVQKYLKALHPLSGFVYSALRIGAEDSPGHVRTC